MDEICEYSLAHNRAEIPATTTIDNPILGKVPACTKCAEFAERMKGK